MQFTELIDLASDRVGGAAVLANDEFFAAKENLTKPTAPVWREGEYTERGKWMDGWETRRRRAAGYDWCIVRLGLPGIVRGLVVDTSFFTGNYPEACSLDACTAHGVPDPHALAADDARWTEILPRTPLEGSTANLLPIDSQQRFTHVRLNIYPDGGVARLRVHGIVVPDWARVRAQRTEIDLAAAKHGGLVVLASDMHYGDRQNLIMPGAPHGMFDGWETKRRRGAGHDWVIVRLGAPGSIRRVLVDTSYFRGNAPGSCSLEACDAGDHVIPPDDALWRDLVARSPLQPHAMHELDAIETGRATHVRFNIYPDGGVARLRLFGVPELR